MLRCLFQAIFDTLNQSFVVGRSDRAGDTQMDDVGTFGAPSSTERLFQVNPCGPKCSIQSNLTVSCLCSWEPLPTKSPSGPSKRD